MKKVLVCITIQENSRRLIDTGSLLAKEIDGELHILHIKKGETIFDTPNSSELLEELFSYGSELGGEVHFLCSQEIPKTIQSFVHDEKITNLIIGRPANLKMPTEIDEAFKKALSHIEITLVSNQTKDTLPV